MLDDGLRQLCPFSVPGHEASLSLLALTSHAQLVSVAGQDVCHYGEHDRPTTAQALILDPTGRFVYLVQPQAIDAFRNPAAGHVPCRVELVQPVTGKAVKDVYAKLVLTIRNGGPVAVHALKATLQADGVAQPYVPVKVPELPLLPGAAHDLEFAVRSPSLGVWPLQLHLELMDEGGPPATHLDLALTVESLPS
jgi:hypothetical protein